MKRGVSVYLGNAAALTVFTFIAVLFLAGAVSANTYVTDVYFTVPDTVYVTNERIELKGYVYQNNTNNNTGISSSGFLNNAPVSINPAALTSLIV